MSKTPPFSGTISCKSILEQGKRPIEKLLVDPKKRSKDFSYILRLAKSQKVPIEYVEKSKLNELAGMGNGGMALLAGKRNHDRLEAKRISGFYCFVTGVEDPFNLGSICRSLYAFGCRGLILLEHDWSSQENTIEKSSAGAWEKLDIFFESPERVIELAKESQVPLLAASRKPSARALESFCFPENFLLAIGGALRGLPASIEEAADALLYIDYETDFRNALDTPSSCAIFSYAYHLQAMKGNKCHEDQ